MRRGAKKILFTLALAIVFFTAFFLVKDTLFNADILIQQPPLGPTNLSVTEPADHSKVSLSWADNSNNEDYFVVERAVNPDYGFTVIANLPANSTSYEDRSTEGKRYFYRVKACITNGNSNSIYSDIETPAREEQRDLLQGVGDFEYSSYNDWEMSYGGWHNGRSDSTDADSVANGWGKLGLSTIDSFSNKSIYQIKNGVGIDGSNAQYFALKKTTVGLPNGEEIRLRSNLPLQNLDGQYKNVMPGDTVTFAIDKIALSENTDLPNGSTVKYFMMCVVFDKNYSVISLGQYAYITSDEISKSINFVVPPEAYMLQPTVGIITYGNIGTKIPGITLDGAHLFYKKAGASVNQTVQVPAPRERSIKVFSYFHNLYQDDLYDVAKGWDGLVSPSPAIYTSALKYYNPNLKYYYYDVPSLNDNRSAVNTDRPEIGQIRPNMAQVLNTHPEWLFDYDPNTLEPPSGDRRDHPMLDGSKPADPNLAYKKQNTAGQPLGKVFDDYYQNEYMLDISNQNFLDAWKENLVNFMTKFHADGVMLDAALHRFQNYKKISDGSSVLVMNRTPDQAQTMQRTILPYLKTNGFKVAENLCREHIDLWPAIAEFDPFWDPANQDPALATDAIKWRIGNVGGVNKLVFDNFTQADKDRTDTKYQPNTPEITADIFFQEWAFIGIGSDTTKDPKNQYTIENHWEHTIRDEETIFSLNQKLPENEQREIFQNFPGVDREDDPMINAISETDKSDPSKLNIYDNGWGNFALTSFLLGSNKYSWFGVMKNFYDPTMQYLAHRPELLNYSITTKLGDPSAARDKHLAEYQDGTLQSRNFQNGMVIVNSSPTETRTYSLTQKMTDDLGRKYPAGEYTLQPHSGRFFFWDNTQEPHTVNRPVVSPLRSFTYRSSITISGTIDATANQLLVNDKATGLSGLSWNQIADLAFGINTFVIKATNVQGNQSEPITITIERRKPADANNDGAINIKDFSVMLANWGRDTANADFNEDGKVDLKDFSSLMANWGK